MKKNNKYFIPLIVFTISFSLFLLLFFRIDPDYFWHFKAGEAMIKRGIFKSDVFSWFMYSKYWVSHEWLFDVIIYSFKTLFGSWHVLIYCFITLSLLLLILLVCNKDKYLKNIVFTFVWYMIFFVLILGYIQARPHMISFSLLALTIYCLYDSYENVDSKKIYFLPLITIIWANVHGGSSNLPYLFCLLFIVGGMFSFNKRKIQAKRLSKKQIIKYFSVMIMCVICVGINIHGFKMLTYPYLNMLDNTMIGNISEWRSTTLNEMYHYVYFIVLVIIFFIMLFSDKKIEFIDLLLFGVSTYLGLKSIRFWIYVYIIMTFTIFKYIKKRNVDKGTISSMLIGSLAFCLIFICNIKEIKYECYLDKEIISVIKKESPKRLYNMYDYGGELIYNDISVFIDGRADLYSKYNYKDYLKISKLEGNFNKMIEKYDFDYFLVDKKYPINNYLKDNLKYVEIYSKGNTVFYKCVN